MKKCEYAQTTGLTEEAIADDTENLHHLVTVTVTYRVDDTLTHDEAINIVEYALHRVASMDGVTLTNSVDGFCSAIRETENGIVCDGIVEWGEQSE